MSELKLYRHKVSGIDADIYHADETDALLAEKDAEIERLTGRLDRRNKNNFELWGIINQKEGKILTADGEIRQLHSNLNECIERGTEAEGRLLAMRVDLPEEIQRRREAERKLKEEERLSNARRDTIKYSRADLKTATDALKEAHRDMNQFQYDAACKVIIKALVDIEGEYMTATEVLEKCKEMEEYLNIPIVKEPDWSWLWCMMMDDPITDRRVLRKFLKQIVRAILYLKEQNDD